MVRIRAAVSGVSEAFGSIQGHLNRVLEYNKQLSNGSTLLNAAIAASTGYFGMQQLEKYAEKALDAKKSQAQLTQALQAAGEFSDGYLATLKEQAGALHEVTGVGESQIRQVQRILISNGVQKHDIKELTALTLDLAAARQLDAAAAAQMIGRGISGEDIELGRYGIHVDKALGREDQIKALKAQGNRIYGGQAKAIFDTEGSLGQMEIAMNRLKKTVGTGALEVGQAFADGFIPGVEKTTRFLEEIVHHGGEAENTLKKIATVMGQIAGVGLKFTPLIAGLAALPGLAIYAVAGWQALKVLFFGFFPMIGIMQQISALAGVGVKGVLQLATTFQVLQVMGMGALALIAGYMLGTFLDSFDFGGAHISDWLGAFIGAWDATMDQFAGFALETWENVKFNFQTFINDLVDIAKAGWRGIQSAWMTGQATMVQMLANFKSLFGGDTSAEDAVVQQYTDEIEKLRQAGLASGRANDEEMARRLADYNARIAAIRAGTAAAVADDIDNGAGVLADAWARLRGAIPNDRPKPGKKEEPDPLYHAKNLLQDLDASAAANRKQLVTLQLQSQSLDEQLATLDKQQQKVKETYDTRVQTLSVLLTQLKFTDYIRGLSEAQLDRDVQSLTIQKQIEEVKRKQFKVQTDLADKQLHLAELEREQITASPFLTNYQKQAQGLPILQRENELLQQQIDLTAKLLAAPGIDETTRVLYQDRLDKLQEKQVAVQGDIVRTTPLTWRQQITAQLVQMQDQFGDTAQQVASIFTQPVNTAITSITDNITGLIKGSETLGEAFSRIGEDIVTTFIRMTVQALAFAAVMSLVAFLTGGSSIAVGGAAGGIFGLFALGGYTGSGGRDEPAGVVHRGEYVIPAPAVNALGLDFLDSLRVARPGYAAGGLVGITPGTAAGSGAAGPRPLAAGRNLNVGLLFSENERRRFLESVGDAFVIDAVRRNRLALGIPG